MGMLAVSPPSMVAANTRAAFSGPTPNDSANSGRTGTVAPMPNPSAMAGRWSWKSIRRRGCAEAPAPVAGVSGWLEDGCVVTQGGYTYALRLVHSWGWAGWGGMLSGVRALARSILWGVRV